MRAGYVAGSSRYSCYPRYRRIETYGRYEPPKEATDSPLTPEAGATSNDSRLAKDTDFHAFSPPKPPVNRRGWGIPLTQAIFRPLGPFNARGRIQPCLGNLRGTWRAHGTLRDLPRATPDSAVLGMEQVHRRALVNCALLLVRSRAFHRLSWPISTDAPAQGGCVIPEPAEYSLP